MPIELEKFAWPGGYSIRYFFEQSREVLVLCWDCATKAVNGIADKNSDYEDYKFHSSFIHWEGESIWCDDCGVELESEYGVPDSEENEPQIDSGELACEKTPTVVIPPEDDEWKKAMLPPYPLHESEVDVLQYEREVTEYK